jgi:hypothetical protein
MPDDPQRYQSQYPHSMPWSRRVRVLQEGDVIQHPTGRQYRVIQTIRSELSRYPRIILEPYNVDQTEDLSGSASPSYPAEP